MALHFSEHVREDVTILNIEGRLVAGEEATEFRDKVKELTAAGKTKVVLNLKEVEYIDSTGLGALVMCANTVRNAGGVQKLLNLNRRNVELLVMTKLATIFEIFDDEQDAVNSFFPDREIKKFDILSFVKSQKKN